MKGLSTLLGGVTSKHDGDCYCLNCFHSYRSENKHKNNYNVFKNMIIVI